MQQEDGFHFHARPSLSGETKSLIVILHGHSSHPDKYLKWADKTQAENPDADVLIIQGPVPLKATEVSKKAYNLPDVDDLYTWFGAKSALKISTPVDTLNAFIDGQLKKRNLEDKNLAFIGFSMGGVMAVQASLRRKEECAAVVCHSGVVLPFTKAAQKSPTLLIVGNKDAIFFRAASKDTKKKSVLTKAFGKLGTKVSLHHKNSLQRLQKLGVPVEEKVFEDQGHVVTESSWQEASHFVAQKLKLKK